MTDFLVAVEKLEAANADYSASIDAFMVAVRKHENAFLDSGPGTVEYEKARLGEVAATLATEAAYEALNTAREEYYTNGG